jgi:hypothetical protein
VLRDPLEQQEELELLELKVIMEQLDQLVLQESQDQLEQ